MRIRTRSALLAATLTAALANILAFHPAAPAASPKMTVTQARVALSEARQVTMQARTALRIAQDARARGGQWLASVKRREAVAQAQARQGQEDLDRMARDLYIGGETTLMLVVLVTSSEKDTASRVSSYEHLTHQLDRKASIALNAAKYARHVRDSAQNAQRNVGIVDRLVAAAQDVLAQAMEAERQARSNYQRAISPYMPPAGPPIGDIAGCRNWLARLLYDVGFTGEDNREAWAIVMRESGGREDAISSTDDWGMFQFNRPTWGGQDWWDDQLMLDRRYNAAIAARISRNGKTWLNWGLDGHGGVRASLYENAGWTDEMIQDRIARPFAKWYAQYPCTVPTADDSTPGSATSERSNASHGEDVKPRGR